MSMCDSFVGFIVSFRFRVGGRLVYVGYLIGNIWLLWFGIFIK